MMNKVRPCEGHITHTAYMAVIAAADLAARDKEEESLRAYILQEIAYLNISSK